MANFVNYQVEMIPENASIIDKINGLLISGYDQETTKDEKPKKDKPKKDKPSTSAISMDDLKTAAKKSKKDHGEKFTTQVIEDNGVEAAATLGRSMSAIPEDKYETIIKAWKAGPTESDDLDDDDGFGDDEDAAEIDPEAVKIALKAFSKENGREDAKAIMTENGAKALSNVDDCNQEQLAAMMKAMV